MKFSLLRWLQILCQGNPSHCPPPKKTNQNNAWIWWYKFLFRHHSVLYHTYIHSVSQVNFQSVVVWLSGVFVTLFLVTKKAWRKQLKDGKVYFCLKVGGKLCLLRQGSHNNRSSRQLVTWVLQTEGRDRWMLMLSSVSPLDSFWDPGRQHRLFYHSGWVFPPQWNTVTDTFRGVSMPILNFRK